MSWTNHINNVRNKLAKSIGLIYKARKVFYHKTLITLYYSFLYPHLSYCVQMWGSACHSHILPLIKLQKRVVRIIKSAPYRAQTEPLFQELNILPFYKIFQYSVIIFMFKYCNNMLPPLFAQLYLKNCDFHNYDTRNSNKLAKYKFNTSAMQKSFLNMSIGIKLVII